MKKSIKILIVSLFFIFLVFFTALLLIKKYLIKIEFTETTKDGEVKILSKEEIEKKLKSVKREKYYFVKEIDCSKDSIEDILKSSENFILEIGTEWCYPCWLAKNYFEDNGNQFKNISFFYIDADKCKNFDILFDFLKLEKYEIRVFPTFFYYKKGEVKKYIGYEDITFKNLLSEYKINQ